jgi:hypothetical protein
MIIAHDRDTLTPLINKLSFYLVGEAFAMRNRSKIIDLT